MKILFVGRNCKVGGGCTFRYRASKGLIARGHEVSLLAQGGPMLPRFRELGVRYFKVPPTPLNRWKLVSVLRRNWFDIVHAVTPTAGDDASFALKWVNPRPRLVVSVHGVLPDHVQGNPCLRDASELIVFDEAALTRLRRIPFLAHRRIHKVPRPVERRSKPSNEPSHPFVAMVSRLSGLKGPTALAVMDAIAALQQQYPGLSVAIVGGGSMEAEIRQRAEIVNRNCGRKVIDVLGMLVDPFPTMAQATCVIGAAYVALEALFHEIPVVAAGYEGYGVVHLGNLDDAIACNFGDGYPGVCDKVTVETFIEGIQEVFKKIATPEGRGEYRQIRERLEQRHSVAKVAESLEGIYTLALEGSAGNNG